MKINKKVNVFLGLLLIFYSLQYNYALLGGIGVYSIITGLFEIKKNNSNKFLAIAALILAISLILTYFQLSSPSYSGNLLIACGLAILFLLAIIMDAYDAKHDNKITLTLQMNNVSQKNKDIIAIGLLILGLIVGFLIVKYFY
jgi:predicted neutral ceramidase superfamily lipid hydrolase